MAYKIKHPDHNNPVVIFKGGGYDGCFWAWNAIFFERNPSTKRLTWRAEQEGVSGYSGKAVLRAFQESLREGLIAAKKKGEYFIVNTQAKYEHFCEEWNEGFVRSVARAGKWDCQCGKCKEWHPADDLVCTSYKGNGGIGIELSNLRCYECANEDEEEYFREDGWPHMSIKERVAAIKEHNSQGGEVSIFAARHDDKCPVYYSDAVWDTDWY